MSPLAVSIIGSVLRAVLAAAGGYLVGHHWLTDSQAQDAQEKLLAYLLAHAEIYGPVLLALAWSIVQKYGARLKQIAAADLPAGATDEQIDARAKTPTVKEMVFKSLGLVLAVALGAGTIAGCASIRTHVSPVADVANAGAKIEDSAHAIFVAAQQANSAGLVSRQALDDVAIAVNKIGHLGLDLKNGLDAYNAAKSAGKDLTAQRAAVQQVLAAVSQALQDVGKAIPPGTVQQIDQAASSILGIIAQVKGATL